MSLSCDCDHDGESWYIPADDYAPLATKRGRKCISCGARIPVAALSLELLCYRIPEGDVEERIYGEDGEVQTTTRYWCEECADMYFNLDALGFCCNLGDNLRDLVREYAETYGPKARAAA